MTADGYVIVGPNGLLPGTFTTSLENARRDMTAVAILNRYRAADVYVCAATLATAPAAERFTLSTDEQLKLDVHIAAREVARKGRGTRR